MEQLAVLIPIASIVFILATLDVLAGRFGVDSREPIGDGHRR